MSCEYTDIANILNSSISTSLERIYLDWFIKILEYNLQEFVKKQLNIVKMCQENDILLLDESDYIVYLQKVITEMAWNESGEIEETDANYACE